MRNLRLHRAISIYALIGLIFLSCTKNIDTAKSLAESCPKLTGNVALKEGQKIWVTKIADGDTFTACLLPNKEGSIRIRVLGIDCPESHANAKCKRDEKKGKPSCEQQIPLGKKATARARRLLYDQVVSLESPKGTGQFERDNFGRWLAYVRTPEGRDFGKTMIKDGHCENYQWKYPHPRGAEYGQSKP